MCSRLRLWEYTSGGLSGPVRIGLRFSDVRNVADALGIAWSETLIEKLAICQTVILEQDYYTRQQQAE